MGDPDDIESVLAANLKSLREALGLSQAALAELARLSTTSVYRFEAKERWPKPENVKALAEALGCPQSRLFARDGTSIPAELMEHVAAAARACGLKVSKS